ncbi:hypothetical protein FisN_32Hh020 [Fistulifera solaris]|uniref:PDZ domain-containing protein n=1 Tax=Fistulifera solaris TaxID=1519565 RepID=A0A1Z5K3U7_FISSO|nr:hypothetical protein FisN_32Hh020 [Fistulifera solaris]|eukprot:GAX20638.1 hypothetical protein FisN_32Hh020 [Fistulifera solaris]
MATATATAVPLLNPTPNLIPSPFPAPQIYRFSIPKENDAPIGIKMEQKLQRNIVICGIHEGTPFERSGARVGQEILMINGSVTNSPRTAAALIRSTPTPGIVTLVTADPTHSSLYKHITVSPTSVRWTLVREGTLLRLARVFAKASSTGLNEGDIVLAVQGRPVSTMDEVHRIVQAEQRDDVLLSFYVLDPTSLRDSIWRAVTQRIRASRYKELVGDTVTLRPIADTFEDRTDIFGVFIQQRLKARVVFDPDTYRMMDPWQYWSARYLNGRIEHESAMEYHRSSYKKVLAVMREYNRILEYNLRQLEELVCQECWRLSSGVAATVAEFATVEVDHNDDEDTIPLATATFY